MYRLTKKAAARLWRPWTCCAKRTGAPTWRITTPEGNFREECIQPEEQSPEMSTLFNTGAAICRELIKAVPQRKVNEK